MSERKEVFDKPPLDIDQLVELLKKRGLNIDDVTIVKYYLQFIGYYRLSAYFLSFQDGSNSNSRHQFQQNTTFTQILDLYIFDRKLRLLVLDAIERIEVAIKASISNTMSQQSNAHWFMDNNNFQTKFDHQKFIERLKNDIEQNKREEFISHYRNKYNSPDLPPSWMVFEILSFGTVSIVFKNLELQSKKKIAKIFDLDEKIISSWLHSISYFRNLCAHHCRIWDRTFTIKPKKANAYKEYLAQNNKLYAQLAIIQILMQKITIDSHWSDNLKTLIQEYSSIPIQDMGFPEDWHNYPLWKNNK
ncbi:MAG: Abi family protein [Xenococcaceae cyanobacterium MO_167.B52]|nr:Abi family protein [Xenococcaceae cyanobacterium MO_167.B52]